jgi:outer membrane immunogenic protein
MKLKLALVFAAATISAPAFCAQPTDKFEGVAVQFGTGYQQNKMGGGTLFLNNTGANSGASIASGDNNKVPAVVEISYGLKMSPQFILGLGASYDFSSASIVGNCVGCAPAAAITTKIQNRYNIYFAPGVKTSEDGLAYVKLGYSGISTSVAASDGSALTNGLNNHAVSYGVGYKQFFNSNIYGFAEMNYAKHNSGNITGPTVYYSSDIKSTSYLLGVGYKF